MGGKRLEYEFGYVPGRVKWKLIAAKAVSLLWVSGTLYELVFLSSKTSAKLIAASGCVAGIYVYTNLYQVRLEIRELFEPPYPCRGNGLSLICFICSVAAIYYQLNGD
jgi:hypothetical protein